MSEPRYKQAVPSRPSLKELVDSISKDELITLSTSWNPNINGKIDKAVADVRKLLYNILQSRYR